MPKAILKTSTLDDKVFVVVTNSEGDYTMKHGPFDDEDAAEKYIDHRITEGSGLRHVEGETTEERFAEAELVETYNNVQIWKVSGETYNNETFFLKGSVADPFGLINFNSTEEAAVWIDEHQTAPALVRQADQPAAVESPLAEGQPVKAEENPQTPASTDSSGGDTQPAN